MGYDDINLIGNNVLCIFLFQLYLLSIKAALTSLKCHINNNFEFLNQKTKKWMLKKIL